MSIKATINGVEYGPITEITASDGTNTVKATLSEEGVIPIPTGTKIITENGTYDVANYANASVSVVGSDDTLNRILDRTFSGAYVNDEINFLGSAFAENKTLTSVSFANVKGTLGNAFNYCEALKSVNLPLVTVTSKTFNGCIALENVTFGSLVNLGDNTFNGCKALKTIDFPASLTSIAKQAFYMCTALTDIFLRSETMVTTVTTAFTSASTAITVHVPADLVTTYQSDANWSAISGLTFVAIE